MDTKKAIVLIFLFLLVVLLTFQTNAQADLSDSDKAAIKKVTEESVAIANKPEKDWTAYVKSYYAPDAATLGPNAPALKGHEAIISSFNSGSFLNIELKQLEILGDGDLAYVWGTYSLEAMPPGAESPIKDSGKYIEIWRKQEDGSWKVLRDIWNSDLPLPGS